ncbi:MAG: glycosyltransferase [Candidatus Margulisiibacteriota bacterium]|jgi:glycosyltransferase involved in cell wall biosynthesis
MKIAFFTEAYKPYPSGVTISVDTFAQDLVKLGHEVRIYAPSYPEPYQEKTNPSTFRFASFPIGYPGFRLAIPWHPALAKDIRNFKPDIIHAHHPYVMGNLAKSWAKKLKVPLVYTFHTLFTQYMHYVPIMKGKWITDIAVALIRNFCRQCGCIIVPTANALDIMRTEYGVKTRAEVIPTGLDITKFTKSPPRTEPKFNKMIHVGRISNEKNIGFLLELMPKLPKEIKLMIVGAGPAENELHAKMKQMGLTDRVDFIGYKPREELINYFVQADMFVAASKSETQGLVFMEAKAGALPTVAIGAAGALDMVEDSGDGFLTTEDLDLFAEKVMTLYKDKALYQKFSIRTLENLEKLSSIRQAEKLVGVYKSLMDAVV